MSARKRNVGAVFAVLREKGEGDDISYEVVEKGFTKAIDGEAILARKVKSGELEPGVYFIGQFKTCVRYAVEVIKEKMLPSEVFGCNDSEDEDESADPTASVAAPPEEPATTVDEPVQASVDPTPSAPVVPASPVPLPASSEEPVPTMETGSGVSGTVQPPAQVATERLDITGKVW